MMDSFVARRYLLLAFLLVLALVFQGSRGLYDRDETRYAEVAREMLVSGEYLIPQRDFRPHLTKPPLTYWALAASMKILGQNEWAVRLPNALAFALTAFVVGLIGEALWGRRGLWAGVIYATSLFPFAAANIVTTDTLLVLWETAAAWAFVKGYLSQRAERARVWFNLMWFFWGWGF
ncbi:ArnT family glycosyltransferase [Thermosulfuriphilus ammonigenes]|nr:glycosyltransferase family 39 protein [Thermosulfuriphilus ammonigenes]